MVYHLTFVYEDADGVVQTAQFCSESLYDVLDYLGTAYSGFNIVAFACIRKFVKED